MKSILIIFSLLLTGCFDAIQGALYPPDLKVNKIRIHCRPECPPENDIESALEHIVYKWEPHVEDPWQHWKNYSITFAEFEIYIEEQQVYGATWHNSQRIYIWSEFPCENKGLCSGVFDWELGLVLSETILPGSTEDEKIKWRVDNNLVNELEDWKL